MLYKFYWKVIEYFQERDDRLNYRSVTFDSSKDVHY